MQPEPSAMVTFWLVVKYSLLDFAPWQIVFFPRGKDSPTFLPFLASTVVDKDAKPSLYLYGITPYFYMRFLY